MEIQRLWLGEFGGGEGGGLGVLWGERWGCSVELIEGPGDR